MKLVDKYHAKFGCKGHTKENTIFRLVGLILFLVAWSVLWMIPTDSITAGIALGIATTLLLDIIGGIGRRSPLFRG